MNKSSYFHLPGSFTHLPNEASLLQYASEVFGPPLQEWSNWDAVFWQLVKGSPATVSFLTDLLTCFPLYDAYSLVKYYIMLSTVFLWSWILIFLNLPGFLQNGSRIIGVNIYVIVLPLKNIMLNVSILMTDLQSYTGMINITRFTIMMTYLSNFSYPCLKKKVQ